MVQNNNEGNIFAWQSIIDDVLKVLNKADKTQMEELDIPSKRDIEKEFQNILDQTKPYLPYLAALGGWKLVKLIKDEKININWEGFAGVVTAFAPALTGIAWYLFTRINSTAELLSYGITVAEAIPTIDLNLPPGVNLGAMFSVGDVVLQDLVGSLVEGGKALVGIWPSGLVGQSNQELIEELKERARAAGHNV
tara:strand:+ start:454 stop:1035 length:582 start_codon:yes stop_codon:yes gene_type:complete